MLLGGQQTPHWWTGGEMKFSPAARLLRDVSRKQTGNLSPTLPNIEARFSGICGFASEDFELVFYTYEHCPGPSERLFSC